MTPNAATVASSPETSPHLMNANVLAYRRPPEKLKPIGEGEEAPQGATGTTYSPSAYLLLVSRLEQMVRTQRVDRAALELLRIQLARRLATLPEVARQRIEELEDYGKLEVEQFIDLPQRLVAALQEPATAATALDLIKQPGFAAFMRQEPRARLYGPHGILRAS